MLRAPEQTTDSLAPSFPDSAVLAILLWGPTYSNPMVLLRIIEYCRPTANLSNCKQLLLFPFQIIVTRLPLEPKMPINVLHLVPLITDTDYPYYCNEMPL